MHFTHRRHFALIVLILLLAATTRIIGVTDFALWADEGWSWRLIRTGDITITFERLAVDRHPPLYFLLLTGWVNLAGDSHIALRFVAIAAGLLTIALVYRISVDLFSKRAGVYAAAIFSVLNIAVYYTQEVRHYGLLGLMTALVTLLFLRYLRQPSRGLWVAYCLSVTGIMLTHYFGLFVMVLQALVGTFFWRATLRDKVRLFGAWLMAALLYVPWLTVVWMTLRGITRGVGGFPGSFQSTFADLQTMLQLLTGEQFALMGGIYAAALVNLLHNNAQKSRLAQGYIVAAGIGLFAVMFIINTQVGLLSSRMLYFLTPALIIVCGYGFSLLPSRMGMALMGALILTQLVTNPIIQPRPDHRGLAHYLRDMYAPGDLIILELGWSDLPAQYEILQAIPAATHHTIDTAFYLTPPVVLENVTPLLAEYERVWVVQWLHAATILPRMDDGTFGFTPSITREIINTEPVVQAEEPITVTLYQRVDVDDEPVQFGDSLLLEDVHVSGEANAGEVLHVDIWWRALDALPLDYSLALIVRDETGTIVAQYDAPLTEYPATTWPTDTLVHGRHRVLLPQTLPSGSYTVNALVYWYADPANPLPTTGEGLPMLARFTVVTGASS